ncbi:MAG TPA: imidazolonepropionase, partial [Anaerolineales bacterium]
MLIHSASQLLTIAGPPQRGHELGCLSIIPDGAVLIQGEKIIAVGTTAELQQAYPQEEGFDASGQVVMPGLVDPHTHLLWVGDRAREFEMRLEGKSYLEILAEGGGILSTVRSTRQASLGELLDETRPRLGEMLAYGTTTAEGKTGYGLQAETELHMLQALMLLDAEGPLEILPTFLGAH